MPLTNEQIKEMQEAAKPLVKFLCENLHPHVYVIVNPTGAELVEGLATVKIEEFLGIKMIIDTNKLDSPFTYVCFDCGNNAKERNYPKPLSAGITVHNGGGRNAQKQ